MLASCNPKFSSTDFTPENSFTEGVEGPATDANGNIYAVNFEKQGISYRCCNPIKSRQSNGCHHMIQGANSQQHKVDEQ